MSLKGEIQAECPNGCEAFTAEIWTYVQGDQEPALRLAIMAREFNMILCPSCEKPFFAQEPYIYYEPAAELLAFVFPESYREKEKFWREKMHEDFLIFKKGLEGRLSADIEPELFFGVEGLAQVLETEDYRGEEREVMEYYAKDLGLSLYRVSRRFAREQGVPSALPSAGAPTRANVIAGLKKVVAANDRLTAFAKYLEALSASPDASLPPPSTAKAA